MALLKRFTAPRHGKGNQQSEGLLGLPLRLVDSPDVLCYLSTEPGSSTHETWIGIITLLGINPNGGTNPTRHRSPTQDSTA